MFISMQNISFTAQFFLGLLHNCYFEYLRHVWWNPSKIIISIYRELHSSLPSWDMAKILQTYVIYWVSWAGPAMHTKINSINLYNSFIFICMENINSIHSFFFKILQRYYKCAILSNSEHAWLWLVKAVLATCRKLWYLSSCKKLHIYSHVFLEILQRYCKLVILGTLSMPRHACQQQ